MPRPSTIIERLLEAISDSIEEALAAVLPQPKPIPIRVRNRERRR